MQILLQKRWGVSFLGNPSLAWLWAPTAQLAEGAEGPRRVLGGTEFELNPDRKQAAVLGIRQSRCFGIRYCHRPGLSVYLFFRKELQ